MKKIIILIICSCLLIPNKSNSQNSAAIAGAAAGVLAVGVGMIASIEEMKEKTELTATEYILANHPELQFFSLKTLDFDGKKLKDMSSVSVISYKIQEFIPSDDPKLTGKKQILFGFTSYGWVSEQGINFNKVQWFLIDRDEWVNMMVAYAKASSNEKNDSKLKQSVSNGLIVNRGIKVKGKMVVPFYNLEEDMYLTTDYSDAMKLVYNERSLGIFLKKTMNLVQISRSDLIKTHEYFFEND
jgi:hypothetical protein